MISTWAGRVLGFNFPERKPWTPRDMHDGNRYLRMARSQWKEEAVRIGTARCSVRRCHRKGWAECSYPAYGYVINPNLISTYHWSILTDLVSIVADIVVVRQ